MRCSNCGLRRLDPLPTEEELAEHYRRRAGSGNYEPSKADERIPGLRQVLEFAEGLVPQRGRVFDVGCFDGGFLDLAAENGWEGWGLELQVDAAREANRRHPGRIVQGSLEGSVQIRPGSFDLITAIGLVEHLRDPRRLFSAAKEGLRDGGVLVIQTPDAGSLPARLMRRFWPPIAPPEHTYYFDRKVLRLVSARYGFTPITSRRHVKRLRLGYACDQFEHFGPEVHRFLRPIARAMPQWVMDRKLPLYGGEVLFAARRIST